MPEFLTRLSAALDRATDHPALAAVPVLFALLDANKTLAVASFDGVRVGVKLGLPLSVVTVWQFVSVPGSVCPSSDCRSRPRPFRSSWSLGPA